MSIKPIIVVKVGTSTLLSYDDTPSGTFGYIAESILELREQYNVVLVTSGAIGFGVRRVGLQARPSELHKLQALSMIGQVGLLRQWREAFGDENTIGQVLVTRRDLEAAGTSELFRTSVEEVWGYGVLPIVNENDAVSTEEISFGDNDRLAAEVAVALGAEKLVILTDQDGIQQDFGASTQRRLAVVPLTEVDRHIDTAASAHGTGGASSKVQAARIALEAGIEAYIAKASEPGAVSRVLSGQAGTKVVQ
ncbi:MAG: glutamate 5-kinase [Candidatus Saccharimonas sp.]